MKALNRLRMTNEEPVDTTQYIEVQHDGSVIEKRETIFDEDEYIINIGPNIRQPTVYFVFVFHWKARLSKNWMCTADTSIEVSKKCAKVLPIPKPWP